MKSGKLKVWFRAIRPFSFTGSVMPVVLGSIYAAKVAKFEPGYFIYAVLTIVLLHSGVNLLSDYDDYKNKVDTEGSYGSSGVILENLLSPKQVFTAGISCCILAFCLGVLLSFIKGWPVFAIGIIGLIGGYSYTGKPFVLKYRGLGDPLIFLLFGPLLTLGAYYVQTQSITWPAFFISIPVGLLTTNINHANDIRDINHDKAAGIRTLPIIAGRKFAVEMYNAILFLAYLSVVLMVLFKILPIWSLICLITIPNALKNINKLKASNGNEEGIITLDKESAELHGKFGVLLLISILISFIL